MEIVVSGICASGNSHFWNTVYREEKRFLRIVSVFTQKIPYV